MFSLRTSKGLFRHARTAARNTVFSGMRAMSSNAKIIYTETDEAPALATYSLLPIVNKFTKMAGVNVVKSDISLAGRIISQFPEYLSADQQINDELAVLGELCKTPDANVIKLPNISASIPQLTAAISELRARGYNLPLYPQEPKTDEEKVISAKYAKVLGSAVNPVLREGNSDRRVAAPVKQYAQKNPHKMGAWSSTSKSHVSHMTKGDYYSSEVSHTCGDACNVKIELIGDDGKTSVLKESLALQPGEVIDASTMNVADLREYFEKEMQDAKDQELLLSLHLKATMMKVSDPIFFGHCVSVYFKDAFEKHAAVLEEIGANPNNGLQAVLDKVKTLPEAKRDEVLADIDKCYESRPWLAMVNSARGITNLHVPSDVIVDASMPVVVRDSGMMWNKDDQLETTKCLIPDRCYAPVYKAALDFCRENGQFDVSTMGNVPNVGLMAQKAEEYGSHDKTFEVPCSGTVRVTDGNNTIFEHKVNKGDVWRMCQTKDAPIKDWVRLAVSRAKATGAPAIFWLDENRGHDAELIKKINTYLADLDTTGCEISIEKPADAMKISMERAKAGKDTISVTGNVLRDYLTDLFPILELGTSAKMLSIVPLLAGGGLFETGAGGSAPKHVEQFVQEGHLRWDSLGEYLALAVSLEHLGTTTNNKRAALLSETLNQAIGRLLENKKSPSRKVNELDNRASNFYIALYWSQFMAAKDDDFKGLAESLSSNRSQIIEEHKNCQGKPVDIGGYFKMDDAKAEAAMRPSATLNAIIDAP